MRLRHSTQKAFVRMCRSHSQEATESFLLFLLVRWALHGAPQRSSSFMSHAECPAILSTKLLPIEIDSMTTYFKECIVSQGGWLLGFWPVASRPTSFSKVQEGWTEDDLMSFCFPKYPQGRGIIVSTHTRACTCIPHAYIHHQQQQQQRKYDLS